MSESNDGSTSNYTTDPAASTYNFDPTQYQNYDALQRAITDKYNSLQPSAQQPAYSGGEGGSDYSSPSAAAPTPFNITLGSAAHPSQGLYDINGGGGWAQRESESGGYAPPSAPNIGGGVNHLNFDGTTDGYRRGKNNEVEYYHNLPQKDTGFFDMATGTLKDAAPYALALAGAASGLGALSGLGSSAADAAAASFDLGNFSGLADSLSGAADASAFDAANFPELVNSLGAHPVPSEPFTPPTFDDTGLPPSDSFQPPQFDDTGLLPSSEPPFQQPQFDDTGIPQGEASPYGNGPLDKIGNLLKQGKSLGDILKGLNIGDLAKGAGFIGSLFNRPKSGSLSNGGGHLTVQDQLNSLRGTPGGSGRGVTPASFTNYFNGNDNHHLVPSAGDAATRPMTNKGEHLWFTQPGGSPSDPFHGAYRTPFDQAAPSYASGGAVEPADQPPASLGGLRQVHRVTGAGDGQSDSIPAHLADGEYVMDADAVSALGNGSTEAGSKLLDQLRESLRQHKRSASPGEIPPPTKAIHEYFKGAK